MKRHAVVLIALISIIIFGFCMRQRVYDRSAAKPFMPFTHVYAMHYYYAKLVADGLPIPKSDTRAQAPEGIDVFHKFSVFMEYPLGWAYRLFGADMPFDRFLRIFVRLSGVLPAVIVFIIAMRYTVREVYGSLISSAFYALAPAAINRTIGLGFLRESFSLPVIFLQLMFFLFAMDKDRAATARRRNAFAAVSGAMLFIALASWHFTQYYLLALALFVACRSVFADDRDIVGLFRRLLIFAAAAGIMVPYLRASRFLISAPMCLSYAVLIAGWLRERAGVTSVRKMGAWFVGIAALLVTLLSPLSTDTTDYSHVYTLGIDQLRFAGRKPADPSLICEDSRMLWDMSHRAPGAKEALLYFGPILGAAIVPVFILFLRLSRRKGGEIGRQEQLLLYLLALFVILYFFINRLMVFAVFFIALWAGGLPRLFKSPAKRSLAICVLALLFLIQTVWVSRVIAYTGRTEHLIDTINWVKDNTRIDDVILAPPRQSPVYLAYAGRPIVLHGKIESRDIREKTYEWARALMERSEEPLYLLCKKWDVKYFVYPVGTYINEGRNTWRYITGQTDLDTEAVGFLLEAVSADFERISFTRGGRTFAGLASGGDNGDTLRHFSLVHHNRLFKIYEIID